MCDSGGVECLVNFDDSINMRRLPSGRRAAGIGNGIVHAIHQLNLKSAGERTEVELVALSPPAQS